MPLTEAELAKVPQFGDARMEPGWRQFLLMRACQQAWDSAKAPLVSVYKPMVIWVSRDPVKNSLCEHAGYEIHESSHRDVMAHLGKPHIYSGAQFVICEMQGEFIE